MEEARGHAGIYAPSADVIGADLHVSLASPDETKEEARRAQTQPSPLLRASLNGLSLSHAFSLARVSTVKL